MLQATQKRAQKTRERILEAAEHMFETSRFDAVSTEAIAEAANVSKGTIFAHFTDKLGLLAEVGLRDLDVRLEELEKRLSEAQADCDTEEEIINVIAQFLNYFEKQPYFLRLFIDEAGWKQSAKAEMFDKLVLRQQQLLTAWVELGQKQGTIRVADPCILGSALRAFLLHVSIGRVCGESTCQAEQMVQLRELVSVLL
ncbi:Nucleoid occlusion factor SlmA [Pseudovibrio axinellae]|uniref:Nucleoid occlusion factor SlmA n=1 Tax=Pseudovibrio axinellae TaxID=989403 RepID=A0A166AK55_9HYPH|nr:TetR/AcrR family transcriptional regulator [Pseudovibrio axinellae]KZL21221.1 Nucleoid occlusion factor SlmA [Pseudovibrio axinellae]SEQ92503.1 transcriptional regulator, TetR family [Pseudovibrio axinellae]